MHLNDARHLVLSHCRILEPEVISLDEALGRVLAETVRAEWNVPEEARSRFDGYAVQSADLAHASPERPRRLVVLPGLIPAGHAASCRVQPGECVRIMTGAPLPEGADSVLAQESVTRGPRVLAVGRPCSAGDGVVSPGSDTRAGETLFDPGEVLTPTRMALIAAIGLERISVSRRPEVALLSTGDEVRELGGALGGAFTHCNTRYLIAWSIQQQGGQPIHLGTVGDEPDAVAARLAEADADLVISTGGMGQGDRDFVLRAWETLGIRALFCELHLSPGRRSAFGIGAGKLFWGLPGSPWGAQIVFAELIAPLIWGMQGAQAREPFSALARVTGPLKNRTDGFKAVRGILEVSEGAISFSPSSSSKASLFSGLKHELAYALLEPGRPVLSAGDQVSVRFHDLPLLASPLFSVVR
jgi:molybdenum cofactor synthesis domain-containing protein